MKVESLRLRNFTVFEDTKFDFCPGINIFVGANATGKSHALKVLYSLQRAWHETVLEPATSAAHKEVLGLAMINKVSRVFRTASPRLESLLRDPNEPDGLQIEIHAGFSSHNGPLKLHILPGGMARTSVPHDRQQTPNCFVPPREFLAASEGFVTAYERRELSFDATYYDLCVALMGSPLRGATEAWSGRLRQRIESFLDGVITHRDGRFYVGNREAHLVAEGHRKMAMILQLLRNGSIEQNTTLLWDEPESGLNPRLVKEMADLLVVLAEAGLQIFIATHDYLLTSTLSLAAEYKTSPADFRFFCLHRPDNQSPVQVESGNLITDLEHDPILDEFSKLYDREAAMFRQHGTAPDPPGAR